MFELVRKTCVQYPIIGHCTHITTGIGILSQVLAYENIFFFALSFATLRWRALLILWWNLISLFIVSRKHPARLLVSIGHFRNFNNCLMCLYLNIYPTIPNEPSLLAYITPPWCMYFTAPMLHSSGNLWGTTLDQWHIAHTTPEESLERISKEGGGEWLIFGPVCLLRAEGWGWSSEWSAADVNPV